MRKVLVAALLGLACLTGAGNAFATTTTWDDTFTSTPAGSCTTTARFVENTTLFPTGDGFEAFGGLACTTTPSSEDMDVELRWWDGFAWQIKEDTLNVNICNTTTTCAAAYNTFVGTNSRNALTNAGACCQYWDTVVVVKAVIAGVQHKTTVTGNLHGFLWAP